MNQPNHPPKQENNDWLELIHAAIERGMTKQAIADVVGVSRPYISQAVCGIGNLFNGKASTRHLAEKVRNTLGAFTCPFLSAESGQDITITGLVCRGYAHQDIPMANPRLIRHWRACQACPKKAVSALPPHKLVKPEMSKPVKKLRVTLVDALAAQQQAGIIDKKTLPLPEVGAPQIAVLTEEVPV